MDIEMQHRIFIIKIKHAEKENLSSKKIEYK